MPLADHNPAQLGRKQHGPKCGVDRLLRSLDDTDRAELVSWLNNDDYGHKDITDALRKAGHKVSRFTIGWHRRGDCQCE